MHEGLIRLAYDSEHKTRIPPYNKKRLHVKALLHYVMYR